MSGPQQTSSDDRKEHPRRAAWRRWVPLGLIVVGIALVFALDLDRLASFQILRDHHQHLAKLVATHYVQAILAYLVVYVLFVTLSLPGAVWFTVAGGLLFGAVIGTVLAVVAATAGASLVFLATKTSLGDYLRAHAGPWLAKVERGFAENQWSYLLMMRLFPVIPFFIANLIPAFLGISMPVFIVTTLVGIAPATAIYATVGAGLSSVLENNADLTLHSLLTPQVEIALAGLAVLAAVPIAVKLLRRRSSPRDR